MKGKIEIVAVGSDVEVFLLDGQGKPIPSIGILPGTKHDPAPIAGMAPGFAIQEDNVMPEYNIPPAKDVYTFVYNLMRVQEEITANVKAMGYGGILVKPSMRFTKEQLDHPQAQKAGCEPDFCVWEKRQNDPVELDPELRGAGGHMHVTFTVGGKIPTFQEYLTEYECLVMALDLCWSVPALMKDKDKDRRRFYGKAGAFRHKIYGGEVHGLEYRVQSNWWTQNPSDIGWSYDCLNRAVDLVNAWGPSAHVNLLGYKDKIQKAINEGDGQAYMQLRSQVGGREWPTWAE